MLEVAIGGAVVFPRQIKALLKEALDIRDQRDAGQITAIAAAEAADDLQARIPNASSRQDPPGQRKAGESSAAIGITFLRS